MTAPRRIALRDLPPVPKGHCCWCRQPVKPPRRSWCGQACIDEYLIRSNPRHARDKVWERDQGVCRRCGLDVDALEEAKRTLVDETSGPRRVPGREIFRYEDRAPEQPAWREALAVMALLGFSQREAWRAGQHLWEMDHIVPVSEGGGGCGLENLRLLCPIGPSRRSGGRSAPRSGAPRRPRRRLIRSCAWGSRRWRRPSSRRSPAPAPRRLRAGIAAGRAAARRADEPGRGASGPGPGERSDEMSERSLRQAERRSEARLSLWAQVRMSDTERPRCGCRRRFRLLRDLMRSRRGTYNLITVIECMVCGAAWEWGEVCAVKDKPLTKVQRLCRALGVAVPQRLPPKRES